jgi:hypothetical protein
VTKLRDTASLVSRQLECSFAGRHWIRLIAGTNVVHTEVMKQKPKG